MMTWGVTILRDFRFKGNSYNIQMDKKTFSVFRNDIPVCTKLYGESIEFK